MNIKGGMDVENDMKQPSAQEELAYINHFTKSPLTAEEVYFFPVRLCDNEVDRDFERFDRAALEKLGELFLGKSGLFDHQWSAQGQTARIYRTEVVEEPARQTAAGDTAGSRAGPTCCGPKKTGISSQRSRAASRRKSAWDAVWPGGCAPYAAHPREHAAM